MKFRPLPIETILKIIYLHEREDLGYKWIGKELGIHWQSARNWIKKYEAVGEEL